MTQRRYGRPANPTKIRTALAQARNIDDVYRILDEGRFNLTSSEESKYIEDWKTIQSMLKVHGKGAYVTPEQITA